ncbi:hypothetical protein SAMN04488109_1264 [Chryseolinea serpens]|uniref:Uncharacterized protein n=1 Tax=Chryseolinea serpens TaxID=947013 RepID=A0A1M5LKB5_9BACT|nr:hypothetical protein SAMN04488109_1264 [Chryseolinea serpens]
MQNFLSYYNTGLVKKQKNQDGDANAFGCSQSEPFSQDFYRGDRPGIEMESPKCGGEWGCHLLGDTNKYFDSGLECCGCKGWPDLEWIARPEVSEGAAKAE